MTVTKTHPYFRGCLESKRLLNHESNPAARRRKIPYRMSATDKERFKAALKKLSKEPPEGDITNLSGQPGGNRHDRKRHGGLPKKPGKLGAARGRLRQEGKPV